MLWGGRFKEELNKDALLFSTSITFDKRLLLEDLIGSRAQANMLAKIGIITKEESIQLIDGLNTIEKEWNLGNWKPDEEKFEDIHSAVENRLTELTGSVAGKLHTGRSRNDQIATDMRLWMKKSANRIIETISVLQETILEIADLHTETIIPGYTHLQRAQPVSFAFHLLAYYEMLIRDKARFNFVFNESNISPLGSGAMAGSTLPLDRDFTSEQMGFLHPTPNAYDTVSDRDYMLDFLHACSVGMMHLSRLSEEILLWTSSEWKFIRLSDAFTTGSSLMPQKKNSDMAELIRGKVGRVYGNQTALATTMKGLPLSYNRDMQEDKEPVFDSFDTYIASLRIMSGMLSTMQVNKDRFKDELRNDFILATDLADWLVLKGMPFRQAHHIVGEVVQHCEDNNKTFAGLTFEELKGINSIFDETVMDYFNIETSLQKKKTYGSPNPDIVRKRIIELKILSDK